MSAPTRLALRSLSATLAVVLSGVFSVPALLAQSASSASSSSAPNIAISQQSDIPVANDFQVGPTRFVMELAPGEERTIKIEILSRGGEEHTYSLSVEDFSSDESGNDIAMYGGKDGPFSSRSWVQAAITKLNLKHGERATIPVTVRIPANAAIGDHYSTVLFQRDPKGVQPGFNIVARVGVLLLITVKGQVIREGGLKSFSSGSPFYWKLPASLDLRYENTGTVHLVPTGRVEIRNIFGILVDEIPVKDWYVLRNSTRGRTITWQPGFALGYYKATLSVNASANHDTETLTTSFWVIPAIPVAMVLLAIFIVSLFVQVFFNRFEIRKKKD
jgi:hypothetical protein